MAEARIFVTRHLAEDDPWRRALAADGYAVTAYSLLRFAPVPAGPLPPGDWVFAYSRNAVRYGLPSLAAAKTRPRVAAIGPGTAAAWREAGYEVAFEGAGDPRDVAEAFGRAAGPGARVVFLQAANSRRSVERVLGDRIRAVAHIVYRSEIDPGRRAPPTQVMLLTSPLNAAAALRNLAPSRAPKLLAIGPTTEKWCRDRGYDVERWQPPRRAA